MSRQASSRKLKKKVIVPSVPKNLNGAGKIVSENHYIFLPQNHKTIFVTIYYLEEVCLESSVI